MKFKVKKYMIGKVSATYNRRENMRKRGLIRVTSLSMVMLMTASGALAGCSEDNSEKTEEITSVLEYEENDYIVSENDFNMPNNFECHDPAIIKDYASGKYYVFGSHMTQGSSSDLLTWNSLGVQGYTNSSVYGPLKTSLAESFKWAGYDDCDCEGKYAIWAPDIIYNEHYVWEDGSKGAYMMYYSTSSTSIRSCIGFAVSKNIESGYKYVDNVIYSGFTKGEAYDEGSVINKYVGNTDVLEVYGTDNVDDINQNYFKGSSKYNNTDFPNAIDPSLFFDEEGKLWMTYGSWSGGIWIIEMDPATGLPIHDEEQGTEADNYTDKYFGKRIAYGNTASGEGPYIRYDSETGYYWLFASLGWLGADGGYSMRMFRAESPDGPYYDMAGQESTSMKGTANYNIGLKIMGGYDLPSLCTGYLSTGHNSFLIDDGKYYLVYHTRFEAKGEIHKMRIHQMFANEDGWLCTMPYAYNGESISESGYDIDIIDGIYHILNHGTDINTEAKQTEAYVFDSNGNIGKADDLETILGKWSVKEGTPYITFTLDEIEYKGVVCQMEDEAGNNVMVISAVGTNNSSIWGTMYLE